MKKLFTLFSLAAFMLLSYTANAQDIIISEVADPGDEYTGRFVELYNPTASSIDLAARNLVLVRQANGGNTADIPLTGSLAAGGTYTIANGATNFEGFYGFAPDIASSSISGNGDDGYFLYEGGGYGVGTLLDIYGVIDVDGTGQPWEYLDSRAVRVLGIDTPNSTWTASEWSIASADVADMNPGTHVAVDNDSPLATFDPADAATDVAISSNITITFDEAVLNADASEITDASGLVELRMTDNAGAVVASTVTINAEKTMITIDPDADLANDQVYYAAVLADVVEDASGNEAAAVQSASFTTIGAATPVIEVTNPAGGGAYYPGETVTITWNAENVGNITVYVSFDAGTLWLPIVEDIDPSTGTTDYMIPGDSPATLEGMIRIAEAADVAFAGTLDDSEIFAIVPMLSINAIQSDATGMYEDTVCITSGVVTFIMSGTEYYISDGTGDYSGVVVIDATNTPAVGDSIVIAGTVDEFYGLTNITSLISFTNAASGKPVPAPVDVTTAGAGEELEGVIVKLSSAKVVGETNSYGETEVDDGSGVILIDDPYYDATLNVDGTYDITGPLSYSFGKWRVYPTAAGDVVEIPSTIATVSSATYAVDDIAETIVDVPATTDLATLRTNLTPAYGATFEVYQADGTTIATDLASDYKVIVTAQDASTTKTYTITLAALSSDATVTSMVYAVDGDAGTVDGVLFKATLASFEALLVAAPGATFETFQADGTTAATDIMTGYKLIVTAEDASTTKTYTVTVDDAMPGDLIFSEYIEGSSNNKAIEIFNPNDEAVKMDYYQLAQISNGGDAWEYFHIFPVGTVLGSHETYVIITDETDVTMFAPEGANEVMGYPSPVHHNGDDARGMIIVTAVDTTLVDIIGTIGADPGDGWDVAGVTDATKDHTIIRKGTVMAGNTDWAASAGTNADNSEWIVKDQNFFDSLGVHTLVLPQPSDDATLSALMVDGTGVSGFSPAQLTYFVTLDAGTTATPAVTATATADGLASIDITDATDVNGDEAARTTSVTVTAEDGATMKTYTIVFDVEVGIDNSVFSNVMVYPVPSSSKLYIENVSEVQSLTVFDITGAAMMSIDNSGQELLTVDVSELSSGLYMVRMTSEKASGVIRFIKE